jgi:phosphatidylserine/phosphatidylglycerophosphate/cardiolipin synthase-like enzyme
MVTGSANAYANNEVVFLAWKYGDGTGILSGCLGFRITRIDSATGAREVLPAWVGFKGQENPEWRPRDTSEWPVQKFSWRDLTATPGQTFRYEIVPMLRDVDGNDLRLTPDPAPENALLTNEVRLTKSFADGAVTACFNNGILSTQFLAHTLLDVASGPGGWKDAFLDRIKRRNSKLRRKMAGDVLPLMLSLLDRARDTPGSSIYAALYELSDGELIGRLQNNAAVHLILSNAGKDDRTNADARRKLHASAICEIIDRDVSQLGDNIAHNKFLVYVGPQGPEAVFTGSTNWTANALCAQSNNAVLIEDPTVAQAYLDYWNRLKDDTTEDGQGHMGDALRSGNAAAAVDDAPVADTGTSLTVWFSPNTKEHERRTSSPEPADLGEVFRVMEAAEKLILFAVFQPGFPSVVTKALDLQRQTAGTANPLLVHGVVSTKSALPKGRKEQGQHGAAVALVGTGDALDPIAVPATAINDPVGAFERELLSAGNAIVHDKIVVVDPLGANPVVVTGSHNLGYKASYRNDENLLIFRGDRDLAVAYAVHVLDLYDHYRFRYVQSRLGAASEFKGFLSSDAETWQREQLESPLTREYMSYWA